MIGQMLPKVEFETSLVKKNTFDMDYYMHNKYNTHKDY
jgi:hypothetical protein